MEALRPKLAAPIESMPVDAPTRTRCPSRALSLPGQNG